MQNLRRLLAYARRQRLFVVLIPTLTVTSSLLAALQPWPLKFLTDHILGQAPLPDFFDACPKTLGIQQTQTALLLLVVLGGLLIFAVGAALDYALTWTWTKAGRRMVLDLAEDLFARIQRRSIIFHRRSSVGDLLERVMADSWVVHQIVDALFFAPVHALLITAAMTVFMVQLDGWLTVAALLTPPLMVAASFPLGRRIQTAAKTKRETEVHLRSHVQQTLSGISVVQAFAQEEREHERFERFADAAVRAQRQTALVTSLNGLNQGLVTTLGTGVVLWMGMLHVLDGRITVGTLLVFLVYLNQLQAQMKVFAAIYPSLKGYKACEDRVMEILAAPVEVEDEPDAVQLPATRGNVRLDNVTFGYETGRTVLHNVSLEANPGEVIAIVGPTGAGKSTLVGLIPRFFDPWHGRVLIDGHDVRDVKLRSVRDQVALVLQEPFLFPLSIAENIAYGRPNASHAEIEAAARAANAHDFITRLPQGYETVIGERGATLSGGERQRLSIARALLKNAPILILDEPTSALDAQTESLLLEALERLMKGRTTFIIAHRLSTIRRADRIVVLQDGRVAETGTHDELLTRGKVYAHFHQLQSARATELAVPAA